MSSDWPSKSVLELQDEGVLLVEDGNHGEYRPRQEEFGAGEWSFIRAADMDDGRVLFETAQRINDVAFNRIRKGIGKGGDVLFSHKGTVGKIALVPIAAPPFVCSPQTTFWRTLDEERLDRRFLYYYMQSRSFWTQWASRKSETDMADYVSLTAQRSFRVDLPPRGAQLAISGVLAALDDKIEQNRWTCAALEGLARAMFRAWFVDFEPVRAKAAGAVSYPSMPQAVFDALPITLIESELGQIPIGWSVKQLSEVVNLTMGQSPSSEFYNETEDGLPFHQGVTDFGFRFPSNRVYCSTAGRIAEAGDVLLSVRAPVGRINVADSKIILGRGLAGLRHKSECQSFLLQQLAHVFSVEDEIGDGTIYKAVTKAYLSAMPLLVPAEPVAKAFEEMIAPADALIAACYRESKKLDATRDYLLPKLLSGKVRVRVTNG